VALGGKSQTPISFYDEEDDAFVAEINSMEIEVKQLKIQQDKCAELFFIQQKCFQEIADITGWKIAQIRRHVKNAKRKANIYQQ
jgi:RNA polymerase sigma-70 factor (ECF subfamily)